QLRVQAARHAQGYGQRRLPAHRVRALDQAPDQDWECAHMTLRATFGIDPGLSGAVATLIDGEPGPVLDTPVVQVGDWREVDAATLAAWIRGVRAQHPGADFSACVEKVSARPGDGGTSAFRFGEGYGQIKAVLGVLGIPYSRAIPAVWKRHMGLLGTEKDAAR